MTVMTVGLVNSGVLALRGAIGVIMGANIGTTVTNTIVSMGHITRPEEFRRAMAGRWQVSSDGGALPRWRGDGRELVGALNDLDYPVAQACFFVMALIILLFNFVADVPGRFEIELEDRGVPIADIQVRP